MSLKPWREITHPHKDVLEGTFKQSELAADIVQVASNTTLDSFDESLQRNVKENCNVMKFSAAEFDVD